MMKTYSIEWHQKSLENLKRNHEARKQIWIKEKESLYKDAEKIALYEYQIEEAIKNKKETFDPEKFRIKKGK